MSADRDVTPVVRSWLQQRGRGLADPYQGFDRFLELVDVTPQVRRRRWAPGRSRKAPAPTSIATVRRTDMSRSMFSATRLIAVIAVVAVGTGALFFAAGQGPSLVPPTAPRSPSPSPSMALVTERVEPGVVRVLSDGAGHDMATSWTEDLWGGPEGAVWNYGVAGLFRLGQAGTFDAYPRPGASYADGRLAMAGDGSFWVLDGGTRKLWSFDGLAWTAQPGPPGAQAPDGPGWNWVAVSPDGSVWASTGTFKSNGPPLLTRFDGQAWQYFDETDWPSELAGALDSSYPPFFAVAVDGSVWVSGRTGNPPCENGCPDGASVLLQFDGHAWQKVVAPIGIGGSRRGPGRFDLGRGRHPLQASGEPRTPASPPAVGSLRRHFLDRVHGP